MVHRRNVETAREVRISCPDHGLIQKGFWKPAEAAAFAHSHDETHHDGLGHVVIEWVADGAWGTGSHDVD